MNWNVAGRVGISGLLVLLLPAMLLAVLQSEPLNSVRSQSSHALFMLNLQTQAAENCEESGIQYVPGIREQTGSESSEEDEAVENSSGESDANSQSPIPTRSLGEPNTYSDLFDVISWLFIIGIAILAVILLFFLVNRLLGSRIYQQGAALVQASESDRSGGMAPLKNDPLPSAESLAAQGDYRGALRILYRGILGRLIRLGVLDSGQNRTNWEILRVLKGGGHSELHQTLIPVTQLFDKAWYGVRSITSEEYHAARDATRRILQSGEAP